MQQTGLTRVEVIMAVSEPTAPEPDAGQATALLRRYEPVVRLTRGELFRPAAVEGYLRHAALISGTGQSARVLAEPGTLTTATLASLGAQHRGEPLSLRYVQRSMGRREHRNWRRHTAPEPLHRTPGAAAAGLLARLVAVLMRLSLLLRGAVPGGTTAVAYEQSRADADADTCHYYGHIVRDGGYVIVQYWFFYPMNDWRSTFGGVNDHEADWEQVSVVLADEQPLGAPAWVLFASHDETGPDLRRRWDDPELDRLGNHPVVYVGAGSHSAACLPGDYLVTVAPELPGWLQRLRLGLARIVPWWDPESVGFGIPFIDYRRGDGVSIGPGQDRAWQPHVVDDGTDWVRSYRGLWGLDTGDPLGGERAPAGPRYERTGQVRQSWAAPLAWAQLDGEPATREETDRLWQGRPDRLKASLGAVDEELEAARTALRAASLADRAAGRRRLVPGSEHVDLQARVSALRARQADLRALLEACDSTVGVPPVEPGPQDHLRHRLLPLAQDTVAQSRALRVWASASGSVLFAALGLLLLVGGPGLLLPTLAIFAAVFLVEAVLRRHAIRLVVNLGVVVLGVTAVLSLVRLMLDNVRLGAGLLLLVAAAYMAVQTVTDALIHRRPRTRSRQRSEVAPVLLDGDGGAWAG